MSQWSTRESSWVGELVGYEKIVINWEKEVFEFFLKFYNKENFFFLYFYCCKLLMTLKAKAIWVYLEGLRWKDHLNPVLRGWLSWC